jgi:adenosylcobinamide-GDP ribazoletransferase
VIAAASVAWAGTAALVPAALALVAALALAAWVRARLGGLTGDVYGAAIELGEVAFFIGSTMVS